MDESDRTLIKTLIEQVKRVGNQQKQLLKTQDEIMKMLSGLRSSEAELKSSKRRIRTEQEILNYILEIPKDARAYREKTLVCYLSGETVKANLWPYLNKDQWEQKSLREEDIISYLEKFMAKSWEGVTHHEGVLATHTIMQLEHFLWLLGEDDKVKLYRELNYGKYGANALVWVSEQLNLNVDIPQSIEFISMVHGRACKEGCKKCYNWVFYR